ncbi:AAA family ATPase [Rhodobacterales bacterium]|nr:AAA family ATPase [Rhodobacterales bacterium]
MELVYLDKIKIKNFRIFREFELSLNAGLNVLVGQNNSGKTSLIDAIRFVLGTNSHDRTYISESDFHDSTQHLSIELRFTNIDKQAHRFVEHLTHEGYEEGGVKKRRSVLYISLIAQNTGREKRGYPYIKTEIKSGQDANGLSVESEIRDFLATTYLKPLRDAESELSSGRASRLAQILNSSQEIKNDVKAILKVVGDANSELIKDEKSIANAALKIRYEYLYNLIFKDDQDSLGAHINIAGIKSDQVDDLSEPEQRRHLRTVLESLSLTLTEDRYIQGLGYHNILFMAAELLLLEQEKDKEFPLLLIEEPEAHLHPQLQMKLLKFINSKVTSSTVPDGVQCILTTHSPNISSKADPSEVIMMNSGRAWPLREGETKLDGSDYSYLRKFLDATKANVFFAKGLLFVEGDGENILLPTIAKLLGRPLEDYGISVVKYDNSGSWKRFARLFLRPGKDNEAESKDWYPVNVAVLRDLDLWPQCAKSADYNEYGFVDFKAPNPVTGSGGNESYWENDNPGTLKTQIDDRKSSHAEGLNVQCVEVFVSDRWTLEFCLARYGLFEDCYKAVNGSLDGIDTIAAGETDDEKKLDIQATYIQSKVSKTDFAYKLAEILESSLQAEIQNKAAGVSSEDIRAQFADELRTRLPPYIVSALDYLTIGRDAANGVEAVSA